MKSDHHIRVPFPNPPPPKDALYKFKFEKPSSIKLVGSYGLKAAAKSSEGFTIDVSLTMPDVFSHRENQLIVEHLHRERLPGSSILL
jgi:U3 small nucleolar RNA-associated protein 22